MYKFDGYDAIVDDNDQIVYDDVSTRIGEILAGYMNSSEHVEAKYREARRQLEGAKHFINAAVEIMTPEQVGQWRGVRAFLESLD